MPLTLILHGHPSSDSLCEAHTRLAEKVAKAKGHEVQILRAFDYPLVGHVIKDGYGKAFDQAADLISKADIIILTAPVWNYHMPGGFKNFLDGALQAGKHFHFKKVPLLNTGRPIGHLTTKKIITLYTADGPTWFYRLPFLRADLLRPQIKKCFTMCGIPWNRFRFYLLGNASRSTPEVRERWMEKVKRKLEILFL